MTTLNSFRNIKAFVAAGAICLALFGKLFALNIELHNVSNDQLFSGVQFERIERNQSAAAKQYLKIEYPEIVNQSIRIYTNNGPLTGFPRDGLVSISNRADTLPLYWISFSTPQRGPVNFSTIDISSWTRLLDLNNPGFVQNRRLANIPLEEGKTSFIYFATNIPANAFLGDYLTNLVVEQISPVPDILPPVLGGLACNEMPRIDPMEFKVRIHDDFDVQSATFYFRSRGDASLPFSPRRLTLTLDPQNPLEWNASTIFNPQLPLGSYQYWLEANDGYTRSFYGSEELPKTFQVVDELSEFSAFVSAQGFFQMDNACASIVGAPSLTFAPGSISHDTIVTVRKVPSQLLASLDSQPALSAFEFGPQETHFNQSVTLTFPFADRNQDGYVDDTNVRKSDLRVFWFDGIEWRNLGGKVDLSGNLIRTQINHFGIFALFPAGPLTADLVRPREKVFTPNGDGINDFAQFGISDDFEISIFDVRGRRIRRIQNVNTWDGRRDDGSLAESGIYVYQVRTPQLDKTVSGTIGVAK